MLEPRLMALGRNAIVTESFQDDGLFGPLIGTYKLVLIGSWDERIEF